MSEKSPLITERICVLNTYYECRHRGCKKDCQLKVPDGFVKVYCEYRRKAIEQANIDDRTPTTWLERMFESPSDVDANDLQEVIEESKKWSYHEV